MNWKINGYMDVRFEMLLLDMIWSLDISPFQRIWRSKVITQNN